MVRTPRQTSFSNVYSVLVIPGRDPAERKRIQARIRQRRRRARLREARDRRAARTAARRRQRRAKQARIFEGCVSSRETTSQLCGDKIGDKIGDTQGHAAAADAQNHSAIDVASERHDTSRSVSRSPDFEASNQVEKQEVSHQDSGDVSPQKEHEDERNHTGNCAVRDTENASRSTLDNAQEPAHHNCSCTCTCVSESQATESDIDVTPERLAPKEVKAEIERLAKAAGWRSDKCSDKAWGFLEVSGEVTRELVREKFDSVIAGPYAVPKPTAGIVAYRVFHEVEKRRAGSVQARDRAPLLPKNAQKVTQDTRRNSCFGAGLQHWSAPRTSSRRMPPPVVECRPSGRGVYREPVYVPDADDVLARELGIGPQHVWAAIVGAQA